MMLGSQTSRQNAPRYSGLATDLYQLTMAYGYWRHGIADVPGGRP